MTAGKNQAQAVVFQGVILIEGFRRTPLRFQIMRELVLRRVKS